MRIQKFNVHANLIWRGEKERRGGIVNSKESPRENESEKKNRIGVTPAQRSAPWLKFS